MFKNSIFVIKFKDFLKKTFSKVFGATLVLNVIHQHKQSFNRFACFWPKGYQLGSLGKSHQNGDYLKQAMRKIVFPQESNLQPLDYTQND